MNPLPLLQPGDILLYGGGFIGALIQFRTWSDVSHVEIYAGNGRSLASRSEGPREYPLSILGLRRIIRPALRSLSGGGPNLEQGNVSQGNGNSFYSSDVYSPDFSLGRQWFDAVASKLPYGYIDLARFYLVNVPTKGLICSEFADLFFQKCGLPLFNLDYPEGAVCPRDFETLSPLLAQQIWSWK